MKPKLHLLILIPAVLITWSCAQAPREQNIYGVWRGESGGAELVFRFFKDNTCEFSFKYRATGSPQVLKGKFEIDFTKRPITLSVRNIAKLNHSLHTIVDFSEEDSIRIAHFAQRWRLRPITFDRDATMLLKRANSDPHARI